MMLLLTPVGSGACGRESIKLKFARWYLSRTFIATLDVAARLATLSLRMPAHKVSSAGSE
jgi:hypothetical protein